MEKIIGYIRYSSHAQDDGNSVAAQTTCIEQYATAHDMEIEKFYIDTAKSGRFTENRPEYNRMKEEIQNGTVQAKTIVVRALDRLHRNAAHQLEDLTFFEKQNIRLIAVTDGTDTASKSYNKLITTVKAAVAEEYSETLSKNTRAAQLESAKQCRHLGGLPPLGYRVNEVGLYEIDENTAPIIRDIFQLYLRGMGYDYIQKLLKQKGYQTANGNDFSKSAINSILKNQKYMGTYVYDRTESKDSEGRRNSHKEKAQYIQIPNGMPAIISEKDFQKAQENMRKNATKQTHRTGKNYYALNGYLHCSICGKAYSGNVNYSNGHKYLQYRKSCNCDGKSVRADHLNDFVFHALQQCIFSPENKEKLLHKIHEKLAIQRHIQSDEENRLMNQIHGLETAQENLTAYLETGKGSDTILNKLQQNETTLKTLQQQLAYKKTEISTVDEDTYRKLVKQFKHYMSHVKSPEAAALKAAAIQDIEIQKEDITVKFCEGVPINKETEAYFHLQ